MQGLVCSSNTRFRNITILLNRPCTRLICLYAYFSLPTVMTAYSGKTIRLPMQYCHSLLLHTSSRYSTSFFAKIRWISKHINCHLSISSVQWGLTTCIAGDSIIEKHDAKKAQHLTPLDQYRKETYYSNARNEIKKFVERLWLVAKKKHPSHLSCLRFSCLKLELVKQRISYTPGVKDAEGILV